MVMSPIQRTGDIHPVGYQVMASTASRIDAATRPQLLRKAKSRARSAMRTYKRAKARGRSGGGWDCFWAIVELLALFATFVAFAYEGAASYLISLAIYLSSCGSAARVLFAKGIHDVNSNCSTVYASNGRD